MDEHIEDQEDHLEELLSRYATDARVLKMREYIQHGTTTTYDHVIHVARMAMWLDAKIFGKADMEEICAAAILHDYYLYDWHDHGDRLHGYNHPYIAAENAKRDFAVSEHVCSMIRSHMWPLNFHQIPLCRGAWILTFADKLVSVEETVGDRLKK